MEDGHVVSVLLKCNKTHRRREKFLGYKWLYINEEIAYKKIIICNEVTELKRPCKFSFEEKFKWENEAIKRCKVKGKGGIMNRNLLQFIYKRNKITPERRRQLI
jgi:hypothetical protein